MSSVEELEQDLVELRSFEQQATRQNVKNALMKEINRVDRLLQQAQTAARIQEERKAAAAEEEKKADISGPDGQALDFSDM